MAKRRLGQHFLVDKRAPGRIVRALGITEDRPVLEIGPGRGALTAPLIQAAGRIAAVEVDGVLAEQLRSRFDETKLHLVVGDVLRLDLAEVLAGADFPDNRMLVTGNLPYYISKPIEEEELVAGKEDVPPPLPAGGRSARLPPLRPRRSPPPPPRCRG